MARDREREPRALIITAVLMLLTAIGTIVFWATFLADLDTQRQGYLGSACAAWYAWELSFVVADGWMAATAIISAVGLWRRRPGGLFGLVSGGAMVFLGLMDAAFFLQNRLYLPINAEVALEMAIHAWMLAFGLFAILTIWRHRALLYHQETSQHIPGGDA